ncbi:DUF4158 domain-containing protein [Stenomitos frigidus]|uniref:DUF4158 domain-containing protein n=1 Tax=Stenomitos frigidus TaxID=1886765 RepID=UPI001C62FDE8|nr:DUF4158 domain-containing protein [Stenomitos frigidus]
MPSPQETAYPRLKSTLSAQELTAIYTPSPEELLLSSRVTKSQPSQWRFLVLLKTFQRLGYAVPVAAVPLTITRHIAMVADLKLRTDSLSAYDASTSRKRHLTVIRHYLNLQIFGQAARQLMSQSMTNAARTKHDLVDLINVAIEALVRQRFELPAFSTLLTQLLHAAPVPTLTKRPRCSEPQVRHCCKSLT